MSAAAAAVSLPVIAALLLLFIIIPVLPVTALEILDHPVFRIFLIVTILLATQYSLYVGILVFLIVAVAFVERNSRKMAGVIYVQTKKSQLPRMKEDADMPVSPTINYVADDTPSDDVYSYGPSADIGSNEFAPVSQYNSINYKKVFESAPSHM
jgi:hypothetical protein